MSLNQINNFDDMKKAILDLCKRLEVTPISVGSFHATELEPATTVAYYEAPTSEGQLKFSIVYSLGCQNNPDQIIGINLFLKERQLQVVDSARKMDVPPFDYTSSLYLYFKKGSSHVGARKCLEHLNRDDWRHDQVDAKYGVQRNASGTGSVSDATVYLEYSEIPALLLKFPPVFSDMYGKLVDVTTIKYGFDPNNEPLSGPGYNNSSGQSYGR